MISLVPLNGMSVSTTDILLNKPPPTSPVVGPDFRQNGRWKSMRTISRRVEATVGDGSSAMDGVVSNSGCPVVRSWSTNVLISWPNVLVWWKQVVT